jgi:hypothetical protein
MKPKSAPHPIEAILSRSLNLQSINDVEATCIAVMPMDTKTNKIAPSLICRSSPHLLARHWVDAGPIGTLRVFDYSNPWQEKASIGACFCGRDACQFPNSLVAASYETPACSANRRYNSPFVICLFSKTQAPLAAERCLPYRPTTCGELKRQKSP